MRTVVSPVRKCGRRTQGGLYLIGGEGASGGTLDRFVRINPPIPYPVKVHRVPRIVDGFSVLNREPMENWWIGSSLETEQRKAGDAWAIDVFGMPLNLRLSIGECAKARSADEAFNLLMEKVTYSRGVLEGFDKISYNGVHSYPLTAAPYEKLHQSLREYLREGNKKSSLVSLQAAIWELANRIPPSKLGGYVTDLAVMLAHLGLPKDAASLTIKYMAIKKHEGS